MNCRVCGRQFDPNGFQIMVPGFKDAFDRVDCALEASSLGLPPARQAEPIPAVVRALPAPPPAAVPAFAGGGLGTTKPESMRPQFLVGANLALLAAGTAATIYLWIRVFGADAGPLSFPAASASAAFGRTTVPAQIDTSPAPEARPAPESAVGGGGSQPATPTQAAPAAASERDGGGQLVSKPGSKPRASRTGGPAVRPANPPPAPPPTPPSEPGPTRSAPVPTFPVPSSPPGDRIPGPTLPGGGASPPQPAMPGGGTRPGSG